jgi:DNA-binding PadR family transcriptional regulator
MTAHFERDHAVIWQHAVEEATKEVVTELMEEILEDMTAAGLIKKGMKNGKAVYYITKLGIDVIRKKKPIPGLTNTEFQHQGSR